MDIRHADSVDEVAANVPREFTNNPRTMARHEFLPGDGEADAEMGVRGVHRTHLGLLVLSSGKRHCCQTRTQSTDTLSRSGVLAFGMFSSSQSVFQL